ncbi:MAG: hypothetical protein HN691_17540 [Bacteroidetes bacterium]|nr:hypothetical protein [Bacteroidota bacterium]MBT7996680.1 hypothetical protein [Bacteroidota bacterium]
MNTNCDKEPINPNPGFTDTLFQSQEFLDYWYFQEGSWWVYKRTDTIAEIYDTATVTENWKRFIFSKYAMPYSIERYYMDVYHSSKYLAKDGQNINYESNQQGMLSVNYGGGYLGSRNFFWWPLEFTYVGSTTMIDSIAINTISGTYYNIAHIRSFKGYYWISKNFGLVKLNSYDGETWELISHHLIR